jgi:hypothetical protein
MSIDPIGTEQQQEQIASPTVEKTAVRGSQSCIGGRG